MKKILFFAVIALALALTLLPGCVHIDIGDEGAQRQPNIRFHRFTGIETGNAFRLTSSGRRTHIDYHRWRRPFKRYENRYICTSI
jgi:hypothetical protein